jgi:hypothetical protein
MFYDSSFGLELGSTAIPIPLSPATALPGFRIVGPAAFGHSVAKWILVLI